MVCQKTLDGALISALPWNQQVPDGNRSHFGDPFHQGYLGMQISPLGEEAAALQTGDWSSRIVQSTATTAFLHATVRRMQSTRNTPYDITFLRKAPPTTVRFTLDTQGYPWRSEPTASRTCFCFSLRSKSTYGVTTLCSINPNSASMAT